MDINEITSNVYSGDFTDWNSVIQNFHGKTYASDEEKAALLRAYPEPEQVLVAAYTYEDYSGTAFVIYKQGDKFFTVDGGHCSCYGLEDQWSPEVYDKETLLQVIDRKMENASDDEDDSYSTFTYVKKFWQHVKSKVEAA